MFGLTTTGLFVEMITGAVLSVLAVAALVTRQSGRATSLGRRVALRTAPIVALVVAGQAFAVSAVGLAINDNYGFYTSWSDLLGRPSPDTAIHTGGLVGSGQGAVRSYTVHAPVDGRNQRVLVWTPRQYDAPSTAQHLFPVVVFLPGQPSTPDGTFRHFQFAATATRLIDSGKVPPFVAVFPSLMIAPPRDTECTDVPGGPQAETWLQRDVPAFVTAHYRVQQPGRDWTVMGWSTGGFCASKLLTSQPAQYSSSVSFGAYYQPLEDRTTGDLFGGDRTLEQENSPLWLYLRDQRRGGLGGDRLLLVAGKQDKETWPQTRRMLAVTARDPGVAHIAFPVGGHNFENYRRYLPAALAWSASAWSA
ncbi:dienelactone hydrolase [Marmoricola sp. URHA0025 HA25]